MNILMINYEYPPLGGGGGVFNKHLAEELSKNNKITLITSLFGNQSQYEVKNNIEIVRVPILMRNNQNAASIISMLSFFPASLRAGYKLLKDRSFDIVHSMFAIPSAPSGILLAKKFKLPHILSILGGDIYDPSKNLSPHKTPLLHYTVKKIIEKSDKVIALSSDIQQRAFEYYGISKEIDVIHLGIPEPIFREKNREYFHLKSSDIVLATVGRLVPRKALHDLIRIVFLLKNPDIKLVIIGDGPEKENLINLSKKLGILGNIKFCGYVSDEIKYQLLNISDSYVSTSQHEGFGIVFLEAMALGLPVVCYNNGGQAEFLLDGRTGFLVTHGNIDLFAKRIKILCQNLNLREQMSEFNSEYIKKFYIKACAKQYQIQYEQMIKTPHT